MSRLSCRKDCALVLVNVHCVHTKNVTWKTQSYPDVQVFLTGKSLRQKLRAFSCGLMTLCWNVFFCGQTVHWLLLCRSFTMTTTKTMMTTTTTLIQTRVPPLLLPSLVNRVLPLPGPFPAPSLAELVVSWPRLLVTWRQRWRGYVAVARSPSFLRG